MYSQKLKLGILLDTFDIPAWQYDVIQRVVHENSGVFTLIVLNQDVDKHQFSKRNAGIYSIFNRIDEKLFTKEPNPFAPKNATDLLKNVPVIKALPIQNDGNWFLEESDLIKIREYQLDILIKFGFEHLECENLNTSKYGTWFYYHGDDRIMRGGPPGFWEVVEGQPETVSALLAVGGKFSSHRALYRSCYFTYPLSPARHRSYYLWATTSFLPRQVECLRSLGEEKFLQEIEKFNTRPIPKFQNYQIPSNFLTTISIVKIITRLFKESRQRIFFVNQWFLLFSLEKDITNDFGLFEKLIPPKGKFWADPHVGQIYGKYYIFIEEFLNATNKGHISLIEMDACGKWKMPVKVLERDYHLSYPFIFEWDKKFYMVPESLANKTIDLYECVEFPYEWKFKQCLMKNVSAVDTTLIHYSGKWWLFTAIAENEAAVPNVELFLFYTDDLFSSNWTSHPQNPIISDVKRARPAGKIFLRDGKLLRPSQDCEKMYGYGFDLNEIEVLSETEYRENWISSTRPDWDKKILATHTFATCGNLTIIDAFTYARKIG